MNEDLLYGLFQVNGVVACAAFDGSGSCISSSLKPPYEQVLVERSMQSARQALDVFKATDSNTQISHIILKGTDGSLVLRWEEEKLLVSVVRSETNMAMLNVAMNVVVAKLATLELPPPAPKIPSSFPSVVPDESASSWRSLETSARDVRPVDVVDRAYVKAVLDGLRKYVGPAAKLVLKTELNKLGASVSTLSKQQFEVLVRALAARIPSKVKQDQFLREIGPLL